MKASYKKQLFLIVLFVFIYGCSIKKYIPENKRLYTGASIVMKTDSTVEKVKELQDDLVTVLSPKPNTKFLGMHLGLYYYYKNEQEKPSFLSKWLYKKIGQKPVYKSDINVLENENILRNKLENYGFFYSTIDANFKEKKKEAAIVYNLKVPAPYKMATYQIDSMVSPIYNEIKRLTATNPFQKNKRFDLGSLKLERLRLDAALKNNGYYNFNPEFLLFEADTNQYKNNSKKYDLFLKLKANVPKKSTVPYQVKNINIYPNYNLGDSTEVSSSRFNDKNYYQDSVYFKSKYLDEFITLKEGERFNPSASKNTARRLSSIGVYKFVNIQYKELKDSITDTIGSLEANIFLSPLTKRALRVELQAVTKSNNFAGPELSLTYSNRNLFKGGETLNISTNIGYETQIASGSSGLSSLELGLKSELIFPRVITPFKINKDYFDYSIPKTKTSLSATYLKRSQLYTLLSGTGIFGYTWNANKYITYEFNPISINYTRLSNTTDEFQEILDNNSFLQSSFDQQFISGLTFSFTYNEMLNSEKEHQFFLQSTLDVAGNSISLFDKKTGETNKFLGLEYAQYAKADLDLRYHYNFGSKKEQTIATRFFAGYGYAYGNSDVIPFVKQYYAGGPYSVRAFNIRSLGPGTYNDDTTKSTSSFFDKTGNVRLEANLEYRFPIYSILKGAVFADAGNVWNTVSNSDFNDADGTIRDKFTSNFINELGMGAGFGLRIDVQGFVIRLDLAAPFHDPSLEENKRWDFRADEPVFNFAIGYSF